MNKKAVIYARVSTEEQAEQGTSIESQLEICRQYAQENSLNVVDEFVDNYTGTTLDRPGLNELLDALDQGIACAVVVLTEDRLSRNYPKTVLLKSQFSDQEIELHFTDTGMVDYSFEGMILGAFKEISAHNEISTFVRRTIRGRDDKVRKQKKLVLGGYPLFGYTKQGTKKDAELIINDDEAWIVKDIFSMYTTGNGHGSPLSLCGIANHLNNLGIVPPTRMKKSSAHWTSLRIRRILKNELYMGVYHWGKTRMVRKGYQQQGIRVKQPREKWISIEVPELTIVDKDTFLMAQERIKRNKRLSKRNRRHKYLMSGFMRCGGCGSAIAGASTKNKAGHVLLQYHCSGWYKKFNGEVCKNLHKRTKASKIDNIVWQWLELLLLDKESLEVGLLEMNKKRAENESPKRNRFNTVSKAVDETKKSIQRLVNEMGNHGNDVVLGAFRNEIDILSKRLDAIMEEHNRLELELSQIDITDDQHDLILSFADSVRERFGNASFEDKRQLLDILDVQAVINCEKEGKWVEIKCAIPTNNVAIEVHPSTRMTGIYYKNYKFNYFVV